MKSLYGRVKNFAAAAILMLPMAHASAYTVDTFIAKADAGATGSALAGSGDADVLAWVKLVTGNNSLFQIGGDILGSTFQYDSGLSQYFATIDSDTDYFIVKTGNIKVGAAPNNYDTFLFQNIGELNLAVVTMSQFCGSSTSCEFNIGKFSHLRQYGDSTTVPEPGSLGLVAAGLAGLAWARRRQAKA